MRKIVLGALLGAAFGAAALLTANDARACGGCFHPPTETPTVITDHRMVFSIAQGKTTLYDQIKYTGAPGQFAWVLPIVGEVKVGLSSDVMFNVLDGMTQTTIEAPPDNCPTRPADCGRGLFAPSAAADSNGSGSTGGVTVLKSEVVGPYETVQLRSTDPDALAKWLATNNFAIQDDTKPIIAQYVKEHFDFLAMKLAPGQNVKSMRPVSVTTVGASPVLPLRMVAAGTGPTVGITLWVVSEGRYEPQNFPFFHIETDEIAWDWTAQKSNYVDVRKSKLNGRNWEIESSIAASKEQIKQSIQYGYVNTPGGGFGGGAGASDGSGGYDPIKDGQGQIVKTAAQVFDEDMQTLYGSIATPGVRVTRIRSDVAHSSLVEDLVVTASRDQAELSPFRRLTKELNEPMCPVFSGCEQVGTAPRSEAQAKSKQLEDTAAFTCATSPRSSFPSLIGLGALAAFVGLVVVRGRTRR